MDPWLTVGIWVSSQESWECVDGRQMHVLDVLHWQSLWPRRSSSFVDIENRVSAASRHVCCSLIGVIATHRECWFDVTLLEVSGILVVVVWCRCWRSKVMIKDVTSGVSESCSTQCSLGIIMNHVVFWSCTCSFVYYVRCVFLLVWTQRQCLVQAFRRWDSEIWNAWRHRIPKN